MNGNSPGNAALDNGDIELIAINDDLERPLVATEDKPNNNDGPTATKLATRDDDEDEDLTDDDFESDDGGEQALLATSTHQNGHYYPPGQPPNRVHGWLEVWHQVKSIVIEVRRNNS